MVKNLPAAQEMWVQYLSREDPMEKGMATTLQYSCLENFMDRGAWWTTVYGVSKGRTLLSDYHFHFFTSFLKGWTYLEPFLPTFTYYDEQSKVQWQNKVSSGWQQSHRYYLVFLFVDDQQPQSDKQTWSAVLWHFISYSCQKIRLQTRIRNFWWVSPTSSCHLDSTSRTSWPKSEVTKKW